MPVSELLTSPLVANAHIGDPTNDAAVIIKEVTDELGRTPGVQDIHFGMQLEHPNVFQLVVNWDKISSHQNFMATATYQPFLQRFLTIAEGRGPQMKHADLQPVEERKKAFAAPVTEIATFYFGGEAPDGYLEGVERVRGVLERERADGYLGLAAGVTYESDVEVEVEGEGGVQKGYAGVVVIGWESVEKHLAFRETDLFRENIGGLRNGARKIEMYHVQFMEAVVT